jgi:hypothetical protein
MATAEQAAPDTQREWWLRALMVLQAPRPVFVAMRDDSTESAEARQEPVTALVFLAGIAGVLLAPRFGQLFDDPAVDGLLVFVLAVFAGSLYGFFAYWVLGWVLARAVRALGGSGTARMTRHVLAFAAAPMALSLVAIWPLRLAVYGSDLFRTGGSDAGTGGQVLEWATVAFAAWALVLLVVGIRTVQRWSWRRAAAASVFAIALLALVLGVWALVLPVGK